jgi:hypothetical protein
MYEEEHINSLLQNPARALIILEEKLICEMILTAV